MRVFGTRMPSKFSSISRSWTLITHAPRPRAHRPMVFVRKMSGPPRDRCFWRIVGSSLAPSSLMLAYGRRAGAPVALLKSSTTAKMRERRPSAIASDWKSKLQWASVPAEPSCPHDNRLRLPSASSPHPNDAEKINGAPPQLSLPAVRHAIVNFIMRALQRCPNCQRWVGAGSQRKLNLPEQY